MHAAAIQEIVTRVTGLGSIDNYSGERKRKGEEVSPVSPVSPVSAAGKLVDLLKDLSKVVEEYQKPNPKPKWPSKTDFQSKIAQIYTAIEAYKQAHKRGGLQQPPTKRSRPDTPRDHLKWDHLKNIPNRVSDMVNPLNYADQLTELMNTLQGGITSNYTKEQKDMNVTLRRAQGLASYMKHTAFFSTHKTVIMIASGLLVGSALLWGSGFLIANPSVVIKPSLELVRLGLTERGTVKVYAAILTGATGAKVERFVTVGIDGMVSIVSRKPDGVPYGSHTSPPASGLDILRWDPWHWRDWFTQKWAEWDDTAVELDKIRVLRVFNIGENTG